MRRALIALGSTAAGLAALLSFKYHPGASETNAAAVSPGTSATTGGTSSAAGGANAASAAGAAPASGATASPKASASSGAAPSASAASGAASSATRTATGTVADTARGPMQVQLTLAGTKITKVTILRRTDDGPESDQIDAFAIPKLESETLTAQSAKIDAVSGASYTSAGYIQSLQSALDQARA